VKKWFEEILFSFFLVCTDCGPGPVQIYLNLTTFKRHYKPGGLTPGILATQEAEDRGSKPTQANSSQDPISKKKKSQKMGWWSGSSVGHLSSDLTIAKKKKKKRHY
jgi:hypothetical protein